MSDHLNHLLAVFPTRNRFVMQRNSIEELFESILMNRKMAPIPSRQVETFLSTACHGFNQQHDMKLSKTALFSPL
jgi:hypothetical protein